MADTFDAAGLREGFGGELHTPEQRSYDEARTVFNAMIDRRPAVIAQCETPTTSSPRSGSPRQRPGDRGARRRPQRRRRMPDRGRPGRRPAADDLGPGRSRYAHGGGAGGATLSDLDRASQPHGLATTGGRVSTTGVGGFVLGGGPAGWSAGSGWPCDNLLGVELVTADGATRPRERRREPRAVLGPARRRRQLRRRHRPHPAAARAARSSPSRCCCTCPESAPKSCAPTATSIETAPDEAGGGVASTSPARRRTFVPDAPGRTRCCAARCSRTRAPRTTPATLARAAARRSATRRRSSPRSPTPSSSACSTTRRAAELLVGRVPDGRSPTRRWTCSAPAATACPCRRHPQHVLFPLGGAVARGPADYPVPWRAAPWAVHPFGIWEDPADDERGRQWAHDVAPTSSPGRTGAVYLNFIGDEGEDRVVAGSARRTTPPRRGQGGVRPGQRLSLEPPDQPDDDGLGGPGRDSRRKPTHPIGWPRGSRDASEREGIDRWLLWFGGGAFFACYLGQTVARGDPADDRRRSCSSRHRRRSGSSTPSSWPWRCSPPPAGASATTTATARCCSSPSPSSPWARSRRRSRRASAGSSQHRIAGIGASKLYPSSAALIANSVPLEHPRPRDRPVLGDRGLRLRDRPAGRRAAHRGDRLAVDLRPRRPRSAIASPRSAWRRVDKRPAGEPAPLRLSPAWWCCWSG